MLRKLIILFVVISTTGWTKSQISSKSPMRSICVNEFSIPQNIDLLLVGEDHSMNNTNQKIKLIKQILFVSDSITVGIEFPKVTEIYCKDYLETGNESAFKMLKSFRLYNKHDQLNFLKELRKIKIESQKLIDIDIFCFDIGTDYGNKSFSEFSRAIDYFDDSRTFGLKNLCDNFKKSQFLISNKVDAVKNELQLNNDMYTAIFGENLKIFSEVLDAILITNSSGPMNIFNDSLLFKREDYLAKTFNSKIASNNGRFLVAFSGNAHTSKIANDTLTFGSSLNNMLKDKYHRNTLSFLTLYLNKKNSYIHRLFLDYSQLLEFNLNLNLVFENKECNEIIIPNSSFTNLSQLYERFDGLLIVN